MLYSSLAGITVFIGGISAWIFDKFSKDGEIREEIIHTSIAFGGGIIIAAVAFVLVPKAMDRLDLLPLAALFLGGGFAFFLLDKWIELKGGTLAQLLAMLMDFVPEAIALGAVFATDHRMGLLLALFIGLQNLPEAFNAYRDLLKSGFTVHKTLLILFALSFSGVGAGLGGYVFLRNIPVLTDSLMVFSGGGILYLIFQDIAPLSKMENRWMPALGVNIGFFVGIVGQKLLG